MSDRTDVPERSKPEACPQCGDPGFVNPTTGRWQCGNAKCDNVDEIEFDTPPTRGAVDPSEARALTDRAHAENWGGKHGTGFCEACADAYLVAQHAAPADTGHGGIYDELGQIATIIGTGHFDHRQVGARIDALRDRIEVVPADTCRGTVSREEP